MSRARVIAFALLFCLVASTANDEEVDKDEIETNILMPTDKSFEELVQEIQVVMAKSPNEKIACADICDILNTDDLVQGTPTKDYLPLCEKNCPDMLPEMLAAGADVDLELLKEMIMQELEYHHDEL